MFSRLYAQKNSQVHFLAADQTADFPYFKIHCWFIRVMYGECKWKGSGESLIPLHSKNEKANNLRIYHLLETQP